MTARVCPTCGNKSHKPAFRFGLNAYCDDAWHEEIPDLAERLLASLPPDASAVTREAVTEADVIAAVRIAELADQSAPITKTLRAVLEDFASRQSPPREPTTAGGTPTLAEGERLLTDIENGYVAVTGNIIPMSAVRAKSAELRAWMVRLYAALAGVPHPRTEENNA